MGNGLLALHYQSLTIRIIYGKQFSALNTTHCNSVNIQYIAMEFGMICTKCD